MGPKIVMLGSTAIRADRIVAAHMDDEGEGCSVYVDVDCNNESSYELPCASEAAAKAALARFILDWNNALMMNGEQQR